MLLVGLGWGAAVGAERSGCRRLAWKADVNAPLPQGLLSAQISHSKPSVGFSKADKTSRVSYPRRLIDSGRSWSTGEMATWCPDQTLA